MTRQKLPKDMKQQLARIDGLADGPGTRCCRHCTACLRPWCARHLARADAQAIGCRPGRGPACRAAHAGADGGGAGGVVTGGGTNPGRLRPLQAGLAMLLPTGQAMNLITQTDWEVLGAEPGVLAGSAEAFAKAYEIARNAAGKELLLPIDRGWSPRASLRASNRREIGRGHRRRRSCRRTADCLAQTGIRRRVESAPRNRPSR